MEMLVEALAAQTQDNQPAQPAWPVTQHSPFPDGYDIEAERVNLKDMLDSDDPDPLDVRWSRLAELEQREWRLQQMHTGDRLRSKADPVVPDHQALALARLGKLVTDEPDTMTLHTKEAYRLFMGRSAGPDKDRHPIVGARRAAAILRTFYYLSEKDNPYADWMLVRATVAIEALRQTLAQKQREITAAIQALASKGLKYGILCSAAPKDVDLGFRTPYGYALAELMVEVDYTVRMMKTLQAKNQWTGVRAKLEVYQISRATRALFAALVRPERVLMNQDMQALSRADWLPGADALAGKRVAAAAQLLGPVPKEVFVATLQPDHTRRRMHLSQQELRLLQAVIDTQEAQLASGETAPEESPDAAADLV